MCCTGIKKWLHIGLSFIFISGLLACTDVVKKWNPQDYTVKAGDTLYSIAWRYEKDFRELARWNNIGPPYPIYPGQRLSMTPDDRDGTADHRAPVEIAADSPRQDIIVGEADVGHAAEAPAEPATEQAVEAESRPDEVEVRKGDTVYGIARKYDLSVAQIARWNFLKHPYRIRPGQTLRLLPPSVSNRVVVAQPRIPKPSTRPQKRPSEPAAHRDASPPPVLPTRVKQWKWPATGRVVKTFSSKDTARKGIGIAGKPGQRVHAAADGQVVYSGNGLLSYGNLIIIKHSSNFLSAYAYNQRLLVKEGDFVKLGQTIAHMGSPDSGRAQLHFEIRKNGKPVNPMGYLPRTRG
jgi:lipoprotein NlpD